MPIVKPKKRFPKRRCRYRRCGDPFDPVTENQLYCSSSHKVTEWNLKKFEKAVEAAVERRLAAQHSGSGGA